MSETATDERKDEFMRRLHAKTSDVTDIQLVRLYCDGNLVAVVPNIPGSQGSLRILAQPSDNTFRAADIRNALYILEPYVNDAIEHPGKHPVIDTLIDAEHHGKVLNRFMVIDDPGLLQAVTSGTATTKQKQDALALLDGGHIRCAEKVYNIRTGKGTWIPQRYAMDAMNAAFTAYELRMMEGGFYDKIPLKTDGWDEEKFKAAGVRFIPGCFARTGAYIGKGTTLMPGSIVNVGAYIAGDGCMIDGGARVATGAQVGKGVKLGGGSGIEGILEPKGRLPSIIEDNVKVGAQCEVAGLIEEGAVIASGVVMASGKKIFDLRTNEEVEPLYMRIGEHTMAIPYIPAGRIAVSGTYLRPKSQFGIDCVHLIEKPASEAALADVPKNAALYIRPQ